MRYDYEGKPFTALDRDGRRHELVPVYCFQREESASRTKSFKSMDCVGLLTEDGRWVRRDRRGSYAILGTATEKSVSLRSIAAEAV